VAGGSTGFICREFKGKHADVAVYRIDQGLLRMLHALLEVGRRAAEEMGQWNEKLISPAPVRPDLSKLTTEDLLIIAALLEKAESVPEQAFEAETILRQRKAEAQSAEVANGAPSAKEGWPRAATLTEGSHESLAKR
jgi:hypothetical protein